MTKFGLTKREERLYQKALYHQNKADDYHKQFRESLFNRFPNSDTIRDFEEYDLWTLNPSGDLSFDEETLEDFWKLVKKELEK